LALAIPGSDDERSTRCGRHVRRGARIHRQSGRNAPVVALSLGGLRRRIEIALLPDDVRVVLQLDGLTERERHRRRQQGRDASVSVMAEAVTAIQENVTKLQAAMSADDTAAANAAAARLKVGN
jgi:hypothetical protein